MAYLGSEIIQSRVWIDPNPSPPPSLNYKYTYPITVFNAVRKDMNDEHSQTLTQAFEEIDERFEGKQNIIPAKPANNLITYGGIAGAIGSIEISTHIPYDGGEQSDYKIPTERAVGALLRSYGIIPNDGYTNDLFNIYVNEDGELIIEYSGDEDFYPNLFIDDNGYLIVDSNETAFDLALTKFFFTIEDDELTVSSEDTDTSVFRVLWNRIVGRPTIYDELGTDGEGLVSQAGITMAHNELVDRIDHIWDELDDSPLASRVYSHINDTNNPHNVTPAQIGAVDITEYENHLNNNNNPHGVTKSQVGLGNVDNTADIDKPISRSTQAAIDQLNELIGSITGLVGDLKYVTDIQYTQSNGRLDITYNDTSTIGVTIVTDGLIDEIIPDNTNHALIIQELNGNQTSIDLREVLGQFLGYNGTHIKVTITEANAIKAEILPKSITSNEIRDGGVAGSALANKTLTGDKIADLTITTMNLGTGVVTVDKIANGTITGGKIDTHTITGRNIFTSPIANAVLAVKTANGDAEWTKIVTDMISDLAVTTDKIANGAVIGDKIADNTITGHKIASDTIESRSVKSGTLTGREFADDTSFPGTPTLENTPEYAATGNEVVDADWVRYALAHHTIDDLPDRSVVGRHLFSSNVKNRILAVTQTNGDPEWVQLTSDMIKPEAVNTAAIAASAITSDELANGSVVTSKLGDRAVTGQKIGISEVKSENIFESDMANSVLAVGPDKGHPIYRKITAAMIAAGAIVESVIADHSISPTKMKNPDESHTVLTYSEGNYAPTWSKISTEMLGNRVVTGDKMFTSPDPNMVLAVTTPNTAPVWTKITSDMIGEITFDTTNLLPMSIAQKHLQLNSVDTENIRNGAVTDDKLASESVTPDKLFKPNTKSVVIGIGKDDDTIGWVQIETEMLRDHLITPGKMWIPTDDHVVLGAIRPGSDPDYIKLTEEFFADHTFTSRKLAENLTLYGSPTITEHPTEGSDDHTIADTAWVRNTVRQMLIEAGNITTLWTDIPTHYITLDKLTTSPVADRVIGVTEANGTPKFTQVTEGMIENGSVTSDKIDRSVELLGTPSIEVRPPKIASDLNGNGNLIPDVQWVKTHVAEAIDEYNDSLKEKVKCLEEIDPLELTEHPGELYIDDIPDNRIADIIEGTVPLNTTRTVTFNGNELGAIAHSHLDAIVNNTATYEGTGTVTYGGHTLQAIPIQHIESLIRGTYTLPDEKDPLLINLDEDSYQSGSGCCCCNNGNNEDRSYILPIDTAVISSILNDGAIAEAMPTDIELDGLVISRIDESRLEAFCKAEEGWADPTSSVTPRLINGELIFEMDDEEAEPAVYLKSDGTVEIMSTDSETDEDIARYSFYPDYGDTELFTEFDPKVDMPDAIETAGTMIGDKYFTPISIERIRAIVRGEADPIESSPIEVTYGVNVEEDNEHLYRYIMAISDTIAVKLINGTATPEKRPDLQDAYGNLIERFDATTFLDMYDAGVRITNGSGHFLIKDREYAPIDISRIESLVRGTVTPKTVEKYDFSDFRFVPETAELGIKAVITEYIDDRAVTGQQLFTSRFDNMILAVTEANTDPEWTKITHDMIDPGSITADLFGPVSMANRVLGVYNENGQPEWLTVNNSMLDDLSVDNRVLADYSITGIKIADHSIGANKLKLEPMITESHIFDGSITSRKLADLSITGNKLAIDSVTTIKIRNKAVTSEKLEDAIVLPTSTTVKSAAIDQKAVRNITISADKPVGCTTGEIWFQFA